MSLQDMAWLTQGPMAAVDLELDVDSMEQEAVDDDWEPPEVPIIGNLHEPTPLGDSKGDSLSGVSLSVKPGYPLKVTSVESPPAEVSTEKTHSRRRSRSLSGDAPTVVKLVPLTRGRSLHTAHSGGGGGKAEGDGGDGQEGGKAPPWRSNQGKPGDYSPSANQPKFGAIKVHAGILGTPDESKSFVVTNETTSRDLVAIVLASYHVVCESHNLFGLVLEKSNKRFGFTSSQRAIKLQDMSKPLDLQTRYNRADTKFCLQLRPSTGVLTVHDSLNIKSETDNDVPNTTSRSVFVSDKTTCRDVIDLVLRAQEMKVSADDFCLYEVDSNSKATHDLCPEHKPLILQQQWMDPHEYYFQIRPKAAPQESKMRRHSIGSVDAVRGPHTTPGKVLNNTTKEVRRSFIPRIKRGGSTGNISTKPSETSSKTEPAELSDLSNQNGLDVAPPSADRETTMAKLKDSLSKLREHLDFLQKRKTMSYDVGSDPEVLNVPHGDGPRNSDSSDESFPPTNLMKPEVVYKHAHTGYDTGDTSLNESDAGSTSARGNNDSAYASDRMSHTSMTSQSMTSHNVTSQNVVATRGQGVSGHHGTSVQRRRRRGSYTSSDQSSPEYQDGPTRGSTQLRKTQSLYELQRGVPEVTSQQTVVAKPGRIRSASHAQPKGRGATHKNGAISGSDEQLNTWARRKQYDVRRRMVNEPDPDVAAEPVKRSQSFQDITPVIAMRGRPTSADHAPRSASQMSGSSSIRGGSVKMRRTLPKVPVGTEADIEERRKRMSAEIIRRARAGVSGDQGPQYSNRNSGFNGYNDVIDYRGSQVSLDDSSRVPVIRCSPETTSSSRSGIVTCNQSYTGQVHAPQPKYSLPNGPPYPHPHSTDSTPHALTNGHDSDISDMDDRYSDIQGKAISKLGSQGESSQEALQRIINDLRNAATKPYEGSTSSRAGSRSSSITSSITRDYPTGPETAEEQAEVVYSQLAQWGVLEPSEDDMSSQKYYNHEYSTQPTSNDEDQEEEVQEETEEEEVEQTEDEQLEEQFDSRYQSSQAYSKSSRTNESVSSVSDHSDLRVEHPTIHRVLRSCDLVRATLDRADIFTEFGFEIFESTFYDNEGKERTKRAVFRTPSGRKPLLGRRKGAFMPVAPVNQGTQEAGPLLSLVAVDNVKDGTPADRCGNLQEGDYIIEVNGLYVVDADVERVRAELIESGNNLDLVLARPHEMGVDRLQNEDSPEVRKDLERLKLKYDAMKQDAERSQDTIADLKLELKDRNRHIGQLESDICMRDDQSSNIQKTLRQKDEEVAEWKYEANHRNVELARLKYETKQKDDRIAQLRRLLIQQTELMQMHQVRQASGTADMEDFEEHVSAV